MPRLLAITVRDFRTFYRTPRGIVLLALVIGLWGFYFFNILGRYNFLVARASGMQLGSELKVPSLQEFVLEPYFGLVLASMAVIISLLAMRSIPEERESGTLELLLTSPGSLSGLVWGKYLALMASTWVFCLCAAAFPLMLVWWGSPDVGIVLSSVLGIVLCASAFSALALGVAAHCERQLNAAVISVLLFLMLLLLHTPAALLPGEGRAALELASAYLETEQFMDGYISLQGMVYFAGLTLLGLGAAMRGLERTRIEREGAAMKGTRRWALILAGITFGGALLLLVIQRGEVTTMVSLHLAITGGALLAALWSKSGVLQGIITQSRVLLRGALVFLAFLLAVRSKAFIDASDVRRYELSPFTQSLLSTISGPVRMRYVLKDNPAEDQRARRILDLYVRTSEGRIIAEIVDPLDEPQRAAILGISPYDAVQLAWDVDGEERRVLLPRLDQESVASALTGIAAKKHQQVYLLQGPSIPQRSDSGPYGVSDLVGRLEREGIEVVSWSPAEGMTLPQDADLVAIIGPRTPPTSEELEEVSQFLTRGGRLLVALDPPHASPYRAWFGQLGVEVSNELVIDGDQRTFSQGKAGFQPLVTRRSDHPVVNKLGASKALLFNIAAPVRLVPNPESQYSSQELLWASPHSISDSEVMQLLSGQKPLPAEPSDSSLSPLAVAAVAENPSSGSRAVLVGDSDWALNGALPYYANQNLALNAMHWLLGHSWALVERARTEFSATVAVSERDLSRMMMLTLLLVEGLLLMALYRYRQASSGESPK